MADIAAGDVTYTVQGKTDVIHGDGSRGEVFSITFGDGVDTYPTGGVPLTRAEMGASNQIQEFHIMDAGNANGFVYKYDYANEKIRIYQGDNDAVADGPLVELSGGVATPAEATLVCKVKGW